jgi:hypothetical protein
MPSCYYYDEQHNRCNCYVNENLNELLEENVNLRVQLANAIVTVRRVDERCAKLRERAVAMLSELRGVVSEGDYDSPSGRYFLLRKDVAAYEDALRELGVEVD